MMIGSPWQRPIPAVRDDQFVLREVEEGDDQALYSIVSSPLVSKFYSPPPKTVGELRRFITRSRQDHLDGDSFCLVLATGASPAPRGLFQVRRTPGVAYMGEWGFLLAPSLWNSGLFVKAARAVLDITFEIVELHRLEARVVVNNRRAASALMKLGATPEGTLRQAFAHNGRYLDSILWAITHDDWQQQRSTTEVES